MRGKYASCLRTENCCQRGLKELKSSGEWKRWLAYKFRDLIAILPRPGHRRDKAQTPGTVGNYATRQLAAAASVGDDRRESGSTQPDRDSRFHSLHWMLHHTRATLNDDHYKLRMRIDPKWLIYGGYKRRIWLTNIFNAIITLDSVPECFTEATYTKGMEKTPLLTSSYRGISLTTIVSKLFEQIMLNRYLPVLQDANIPYCTQTAYQAVISCSDPTGVMQEAIRSLIQHCGTAFQLFYDLEKAFDSVEYCVLLDHLYKASISGKSWRIIKSFYDRPTCRVQLEGQLSKSFPLERGV